MPVFTEEKTAENKEVFSLQGRKKGVEGRLHSGCHSGLLRNGNGTLLGIAYKNVSRN